MAITGLPPTFFRDRLCGRSHLSDGDVEKQHGFLSQAGALDWVGERLVEDEDPARRGLMATKRLFAPATQLNSVSSVGACQSQPATIGIRSGRSIRYPDNQLILHCLIL